jgi:hypothetical protein
VKVEFVEVEAEEFMVVRLLEEDALVYLLQFGNSDLIFNAQFKISVESLSP